jgi:collagenase-like PrtC family protease
LAVNGTQVQSFTFCNLIQEIEDLRSLGLSQFRISPQAMDMKRIILAFRNVLENNITSDEAMENLREEADGIAFANGYYHASSGRSYQSISE